MVLCSTLALRTVYGSRRKPDFNNNDLEHRFTTVVLANVSAFAGTVFANANRKTNKMMETFTIHPTF